jgi:Phage capsid family
MPTREFIDQLLTARDLAQREAIGALERARDGGRSELTDIERRRVDVVAALNRRIDEESENLARGQTPDYLSAKLGGGGRRGVSTAGQLAPVSFSDEQLRRAHAKLSAGESAVLDSRESRAFSSADTLLPAQLFPIPTFPVHEARLMDRLPGFALEAPSLEYVRVDSVTGAAAIVGEGQVKPELVMPSTKQIVTALKLAAHAGVSWENIADYDSFTSAVQNELIKRVIDLENQQLVYGTGGTSQLSGMVTTPGILTLAATGGASTPVNHWDDIAGAIAALRTGPALATPNLLLLHPDTWAALRVEKDTLGRYISGTDPTDDQPETAWGVEILQSTEFVAGEGVLLDTQLMGRVAVREAMIMRVGYGVVGGQDDFLSNILRWIAEERLNLAVERPSAICHITALPTAAPTVTETRSTAKK